MDKIGLEAILDDRNFQDGLKRYTQGVSQMTKVTDSAAAAISGAFKIGTGVALAGIAGLTAAMKIGLDTTLGWSEGLDKLGDQFGMSGEKASGFQYLANKVGVSVDEMGVGLNTFTRGLDDMKNAQGGATMVTAKGADAIQSLKERLDDANTRLVRAKQNLTEAKKPTDSMRYAVQDAQKAVARLNADLGDATKLVPKAGDKLSPFAEALKKLGVRAYDAKGKLRTFDSLLPEVMDKFEKLPSGINASALAMDLFGARGGSKFLDFLRQGSKGLTDAQKKAKLLGLELSTDEVNAAEEFGFAMNELNLGLKGFWNQIGKQVLPIAKKLVDFINSRIIPVFSKWARDVMPKLGSILEQVGFIIGDVVAIFTDFNRPIGDASNALEAFIADIASLVNIFGGNGTVVENVLQGIAIAIGQIANAFKSGGLAGGLQAISTQLASAFKNVDWSAVSKNLDSLKSQFWTWLTGKGGALEQVGSQLGKVVMAISGWLSDPKNTQPIVDAVLGWVNQFWAFITDSKEGLIVTVAEKMANLTEEIRRWSELPSTRKDFENIGETIARTILTGIGNLFSSSTSENVLGNLVLSLGRGAAAQAAALANIGSSIGTGVIQGIVRAITGQDLSPQLTGWIRTNLTRALLQLGGPWAILAGQLFGGTPAAPSTPPDRPLPFGTGEKYANGGPVPRTGMAMVHAGEYVLNRRQVAALAPMLAHNTTHNNYSFSNTWNGAVSGTDRGSVERWAEDAAYRGIRRAMGAT